FMVWLFDEMEGERSGSSRSDVRCPQFHRGERIPTNQRELKGDFSPIELCNIKRHRVFVAVLQIVGKCRKIHRRQASNMICHKVVAISVGLHGAMKDHGSGVENPGFGTMPVFGWSID